ncbi:11103_t:CDS:2 [Funneliformis mosseae]|uniref:11103_t:CDS:1 n=1 Tax=Funneliformis mosseae TaxID=27381 RepID=A0A9N9FKF7_FUNMO|nr:11103_t:CDS:2 [Funneliformis mosseae]
MTELFSPEILSEIFEFLYVSDHHQSNLFNCVLVNRYWCRTAIPVLWSDPFRFFVYEMPDGLITIYIACLTKRERRNLKSQGIEVPMKVKSTSFDYISFLKNLNYYGLISSLFHFGSNGIYKKNDSFGIMLPALLEILANRDFILQSLELENYDRRGDWDNEYMHLVNPNVHSLVKPVKKMYLDCKVLNPKFLPLLSGQCQSVRHLHIYLQFQNSKKGSIICERDATDYADLIERQESLEVLIITNFECESLEGLANCENLQSLIFRKCDNLTDEKFRALFNAKLPKLQEVSLEHSKKDEGIEIWLQSFIQESN